MGRLFAKLLASVCRELVLLDYFASGPRPANLLQTIQDVRAALSSAAAAGETTLLVPAGSTCNPPRFRSAPDGIRPERAIVGFSPDHREPSNLKFEDAEGLTLPELLGRAETADSASSVIYAGLPSDAASVIPRADVVIVALGFETSEGYARALAGYVPYCRPGSLVVDLGSTKTGPMAVLERALPPTVGILGAHPLFGPLVSDLTGLIVGVVRADDERIESPWQEWFLGQLAAQRMIVTPARAEEHDDAMAFVQALTHFALLSFAYAFVRLDRDPADLLPLRTPVFEPLLYLASRVAYLARTTPDTYRSIQTLTTRPDARLAFLGAAQELLAAIEASAAGANRPDGEDPLAALFRHYGGPWAPDGHDRRERQRREHFLEMGAHLVDELNRLRQAIVAASGEVRAIEERRPGQPARTVVGLVDLDLRAPGKQDVASRIRLRRLNLPLGSVQGERLDCAGPVVGPEESVPLARARILSDRELLAWLYRSHQLVERRTYRLLAPEWFDREVVARLVRPDQSSPEADETQVWDVEIGPIDSRAQPPAGLRLILLTLIVVIHPAEIIRARRQARDALDPEFRFELRQLDTALERARRNATASGAAEQVVSRSEKDRLKHERKALLDRQTAAIDRAVRRAARDRVQAIADATVAWLYRHGCAPEPEHRSDS
jgi:prephenate dehydrogenase